MSYAIHVCSFSSLDELKGKKRTYEAVKALALKIGRFSCFEASATVKDGQLFTRLCADPDIETFDLGYPWTGIRVRSPESKAALLADRAKEAEILASAVRVRR